MKAAEIVGNILDTAIKVIVLIVVVMFTYKYAMQAYEFGYRIFAEEPVAVSGTAKVISISISEDATAMNIGEVLEEKGLIRDANLFYVQELLSGHHGEIKPGIYELSSDMTSEQMIDIMTAEPAEEEETENEGEETGEQATETEEGELTENAEEDAAETGEEAAGAE